jgi:1-acyl-sn-glycerol-3-phosphate acyltransferase
MSADRPLTGCKRFIFKWSIRLHAKYVLFCAGIFTKFNYIEYDYTKYLGPNYIESQQSMGRISTIVSNHTSWCDIFVLLSSQYVPGFAAKKSLKKAPVVGLATKLLNCIFISRGASEE